jgi:multidrug resistance efflux pump
MVIIAILYIGIIWLIFFKLKILPWNRLWKSIAGTVGVLLLLLVVGLLNFYTPTGSFSVVTNVTEIRPSISGRVSSIPIKTNTPIRKGDLILEIEPEPFEFEVARLKAALAEAVNNEQLLQSNVREAKSELGVSNSDRDLAIIKRNDTARLVERKVSAANDLIRAEAELDVKENRVKAAAERLAQTEISASSNIDGRNTQTEQTRAQLQLAEWNLTETKIYAPNDGVVTGLALSVGMRITPLASVMAFVNNADTKLVGRFSQNAARSLKPGAEIWLIFSDVPGKIYTSTVSELVPGTAEGQFAVSGYLPDLAVIGTGATMGAVIEIPADRVDLIPGTSGSATVFAEDAGPIAIIAIILAYISSWTAFL